MCGPAERRQRLLLGRDSRRCRFLGGEHSVSLEFGRVERIERLRARICLGLRRGVDVAGIESFRRRDK